MNGDGSSVNLYIQSFGWSPRPQFYSENTYTPSSESCKTEEHRSTLVVQKCCRSKNTSMVGGNPFDFFFRYLIYFRLFRLYFMLTFGIRVVFKCLYLDVILCFENCENIVFWLFMVLILGFEILNFFFSNLRSYII